MTVVLKTMLKTCYIVLKSCIKNNVKNMLHVSERVFTEGPDVVSQRDPDEFLTVAVQRKALAWLPGSGDTEND